MATRRSSQSTLRQIVDRLADGIVVVGADGCIRFANPAAETLFGRPAAELEGQEFGYPLTTADAAEIEIVRRGGGVVVAELRAVEVPWDESPAILVSLRDVTDRKEAEEKSRQLERERTARAEAEAANQAKSEFLAVMSHELRTPLNAVLGYAELLDLGVAGPMSAVQRQQIGRIAASGRHLLRLVNEILDLAKVEAGRLTVSREPRNALELVDAAIVLSQPLAEAHGLTLAAEPVPPRIQFIGDHDRVLQILTNLLSNAVKFTKPGGDIRVETSLETGASTSRHLHGPGPWLVFRVRDSGIGIPKEQQNSIFAPFQQGEGGHTRRSDGSGLGLTISRRLARLMRGDVVLQSSSDSGSTFALYLPATEASQESSTPPEVAAPRQPSPTEEQMRGLGNIGDGMLREVDAILDAFVARLRQEPLMPAAATLKHTQLVDHLGCLLADIAAALVTLEESGGAPSTLLVDSADIQRVVSDRHGLQRARLGWTTEACAREADILREEVEGGIRRCFHDPASAPQVEEALNVVRRFLEQSADVTRRALERARHQKRRRGAD